MEPAVVADARDALGEGRVTLETTISALETARRDADENIAAARLLLSEVRRTVPRIQRAADATESRRRRRRRQSRRRGGARRARARCAPARRRARGDVRGGASGGSGPCRAARWTSRRRRRRRRRPSARNGSPPRRRRGRRRRRAAARAAAPGWTPGVGEDVVVTATGMCGKVTAVSGALVTVQAGLMGMKVNASDLMPDPNAAARAEAARPPAKARLPRGAQAARRVDALLGGGGRVAASRNASASVPLGDFGDFGDEDDFSPTLGDTVRIKKTASSAPSWTTTAASSPQSGRNTLKSPVEGVEFAAAGAGGGGSGGKKKQKKQKKKGSGCLPASRSPRRRSGPPARRSRRRARGRRTSTT